MDGEVVWARSASHNYWPAIVAPCNGRCNACARGRRLCVEFFPDESAGYSCLRVGQLLPWKEGLWRRLEFEPRETVGKCDYNAAVSTAETATLTRNAEAQRIHQQEAEGCNQKQKQQ